MLGIPFIQNYGDLHRNWTGHLISVPIAYFNPVQETLVIQGLNCHQKRNHIPLLMQLIWITTTRLLLHKPKHMHLYIPYKSFKIFQSQSTDLLCPYLLKMKQSKSSKSIKSKAIVKVIYPFTLELYLYLNLIKYHIWSHWILIIIATVKCSLGSISSPLI